MDWRDFRVPCEARQPVLDAAGRLQLLRSQAALRVLEGPGAAVGVDVATHGDDLSSWTLEGSQSWRNVMSTMSSTTHNQLSLSLANDRRHLARGLTMTRLFDFEGTHPVARWLLMREECRIYYFGYAPIPMCLVDDSMVYLAGPTVQGSKTVLRLTSPAAIDAARLYRRAVLSTAVPCGSLRPQNRKFTRRQLAVLALLEQGMRDSQVADSLSLSLRTVRYEVAAAMGILGARSRFEAGMRMGQLADSGHLPDR